jgi:hypothetical protein
MEGEMKTLLVTAVCAVGIFSILPASAQNIEIGPGGPSVDFRSRGERERDIERQEMRRDRAIERRREYRREQELRRDEDDED